MRTLLISANNEFLPDPIFPLGLAYIAAALNRNNIEHRILDLCFVEDIHKAVISEIKAYNPALIGLSLRNLDNVSFPNYTSYLPFYRDIMQTIRATTTSRVVVGGSAFSLMPEEILAFLEADFGVVGDGEAAIVDLIHRISRADEHGSTVDRKIIWDSDIGIVDRLDELPDPDRSGLDSEAYLKFGGMGNIQTKRGCPFDCIYCTYPIIEGRKVRLRSPKAICNEIEDLIRLGITNLFVVDNEFNFPVEHAQFVCHEIIRRKLKIRWSGYANPKFITPRLVDLMRASGCTGIEFGSDAADPTMLKNMGKAFTLNDMIKASDICHRAGLSFCHSLLIGGPGETMQSVERTFEAVSEMTPTAVICMVGIRVFPKTKLFDIAVKEGKLNPAQDLLGPFFYLSPDIEDDILPCIEAFADTHPTWIFPGMNINMDRKLQKKIRRLGARGPLWEYMRMGKCFKPSI